MLFQKKVQEIKKEPFGVNIYIKYYKRVAKLLLLLFYSLVKNNAIFAPFLIL